MPKSESGGLGGASGTSSSSGVSSYFGKVFAVGRYQVTVEELVAEVVGVLFTHTQLQQTSTCHYKPELRQRFCHPKNKIPNPKLRGAVFQFSGISRTLYWRN
ncbi:hypothetical protein ILYODFUR_023317 [Ilyodon furcidens]|uniref:Uncharacterized protein n=1 Tax=Ilyodon furcidens TaxID=33524 RepID=A0ABV0SZI6_9TELE